MSKQIQGELQLLSIEIERNPLNVSALLGRGKLYYRAGLFGPAANDFRQALEIEPENTEAEQYILLIDEIQAYRYTDIMNP